MASTEYQRHRLPKHAKTPIGWLALCFMGLIFSPFIGFSIHGRVATPGLVIGLWFAVIPLSGLVTISLLRWYAWRRLPPHIAKEWTFGKIVPAEGAPTIIPPVRFSNGKNWIDILKNGVAFSRNCLLLMQGVSDTLAKARVADSVGEMFIPWDDILEWGVDEDMDAPDYYRLSLRAGGIITLRRFKPEDASECDLFDAVRNVGLVPVRIRCEVDCE